VVTDAVCCEGPLRITDRIARQGQTGLQLK